MKIDIGEYKYGFLTYVYKKNSSRNKDVFVSDILNINNKLEKNKNVKCEGIINQVSCDSDDSNHILNDAYYLKLYDDNNVVLELEADHIYMDLNRVDDHNKTITINVNGEFRIIRGDLYES